MVRTTQDLYRSQTAAEAGPSLHCISEDGSKGTRRPESELPGCPDIMVWWKSTQQRDASRVWSEGSLLLCHLVTHAPVGYFRAFAVSSDVWGSSASHTRVSTLLSLQLWLLFGCQSYFAPAGRGRGSSSFSEVKKAQEALASRLPCIYLISACAQVTW